MDDHRSLRLGMQPKE